MGTMEEGARQAVEKCLRIKSGERVVIIADQETLEIAVSIRRGVQRITSSLQLFFLEDFGKRPLGFPEQIRKALSQADAGFFVAQCIMSELQTFRGPMLEVVKANANMRFAHMAGITKEVMEMGMCVDYDEVSRLSERVYQKVRRARRIKVTTVAGTKIVALFDPLRKWVISDGQITKNHWENLPSGNVYTCPMDVNGVMVVDGVLGDYFDQKYGLLEKTPVGFFIKNSRAVVPGIVCQNKELQKELQEYLLAGDNNASRVGEFALGTNIGVKIIIGNLLQDEKIPGIHIALGGSYPENTGADWDSNSHIDFVVKNPTVEVDGAVIMRDGKYLI